MVFGDAGYQGADKRPENADKTVSWHIAMKRSVRKAMKKTPLGRVKEKLEKVKVSVRAKAEHPFHVLKNLFRHRKTPYRGLAKNTAQLHTCSRLRTWCWLVEPLGARTPELRPECGKACHNTQKQV